MSGGSRRRLAAPPRDSPISYALITRLVQPETARFLVLVAGTTHFGTQAASDFVTDPSYLTELQHRAPADWDQKNLQVVLETHVVNQTPTPPKILACHFW